MGLNEKQNSIKKYCYICDVCFHAMKKSKQLKEFNKRKSTVYVCLDCKVTVHPECAYFLHNPNLLKNHLNKDDFDDVIRKFPPPESKQVDENICEKCSVMSPNFTSFK